MANEFLIRKWKKLFSTFDVNKDDVIDEGDATLFTRKFAKMNKLDEARTDDLKADVLEIWQGLFLRGVTHTTEEQFVQIMTEELNKNEEEFVQNIRKYLAMFVSIVDADNDGMVSKEEFRNMQKALGIMTFHNKQFNGYPRENSGNDVKSELFLESWVAFCCNKDETDICGLEKARLGGCRMIAENLNTEYSQSILTPSQTTNL